VSIRVTELRELLAPEATIPLVSQRRSDCCATGWPRRQGLGKVVSSRQVREDYFVGGRYGWGFKLIAALKQSVVARAEERNFPRVLSPHTFFAKHGKHGVGRSTFSRHRDYFEFGKTDFLFAKRYPRLASLKVRPAQ
jgi:hypothetical protein